MCNKFFSINFIITCICALQSCLLPEVSPCFNYTNPWDLVHGVCSIGLLGKGWAHAIYIRKDTKLDIYHLFDPNFGLLKFNNKEELLECLENLIYVFYPTTFKMETSALELNE